jgi:hypothetical protein
MTGQERGSEGGRRALSHISMGVLCGHSPEVLRPPTDVVGPPHPLPEAEHRAAASSFSVLRETPMTFVCPFSKS